MRAYLKSILWDFLLCSVASSALAYTICSGFYATQPFQTLSGTCLTAAVCSIITVVLAVSGYTTRTRVIGSAVLAIAMAAALVMGLVLSNAQTPMEDVAGNYLYHVIIVCACPVVVYALSRWRAGCVVLLMAGIVVCVALEYLYWYSHLVAFLIFACAAGALFVYRGYLYSVMDSESERFAFSSVALSGLVLCGVALLCGVGIFFAAVAPFEPGHLEIKLVTEHYRIDQLEVRGTGSGEAVQDDSLLSNETGDDMVRSSNDLDDSDGQSDWDSETNDDGSSADSFINGAGAAFALRFHDWTLWIVLGCIVALIVLAVAIKLALRRGRYNRMVSRDADEAMRSLFLFFLKRFNRFGIVGPGESTLAEYMENNKGSFDEFEQWQVDDGRGFGQIVEAYSGSVYGQCPATESDLEVCKDYYHAFYKRARKYVGFWKYCRMFFLI